MNALHGQIKLNQYFQNDAAIIVAVFLQDVPLTPTNLSPQQTALERTEIDKNLTESVQKAYLFSCEILLLSISWFKKLTEKTSKLRR